MKKLLFTLIVSLLSASINTIAQAKEDTPAVSMASYEQSSLDTRGTIALRNNTSEEIHNVSFMLEYLDMQGNPMDYENFTYNINIAPGMTKKLDIPAYEHRRYYHYYKTKDGFGQPAFKIRHELKGYNIPTNNHSNEITEELPYVPRERDSDSTYSPIFYLFCLGGYIGLYVLVGHMAKRRNRNPGLWVLLSIFFSPILMIILMAILGKGYRYQNQ